MSSLATALRAEIRTTATSTLVRRILDLKESDAVYCGNKATQLGKLARLGYQVPEGIVVTAHGFEKFLAHNELIELTRKAAAESFTAKLPDLLFTAQNIKQAFLAATMPAAIESEVRAWADPSQATRFAVRSSATNEDSREAIFAGQYDSYLNVERRTLMVHIARCFASLFNPRAARYRQRKGLMSPGAMAVIIQEMAVSDHAGVVFTRAPGRQTQLLIECASGLADRVVSGQVSPSRYFVDRKTFEVIEALELETLDPASVTLIARQALAIESDVGTAQDIEFGLHNGRIHILQSRAIPWALGQL